MGDKFSKDKFPWYSGILSDLKVNSDGTLILKPGKTVGAYTTIVYDSIGTMLSVSWDTNEVDGGEINTNAGVIPKTIEMRASGIEPTGKVVAISGASLQPYLATAIFDTGNGWSVNITGISPTVNMWASGVFRMNVGAPFFRTPTTEQLYAGGIGGTLIITPGLNSVKTYSVSMAGSSFFRIGTGLVVGTGAITDQLSAYGGTLIIVGVYLT
jgi:hypothetical protein